MKHLPGRLRRGDTSSSRPGLVFSAYINGGKEWWTTPARLEEIRAKIKARYHSDPAFRESQKFSTTEWQKRNRDRCKLAQRKWLSKTGSQAKKKACYDAWVNSPDGRKKRREVTGRYLATLDGAIINRLRGRIFHALKKGQTKSASTLELIGCATIRQFREHLEKQFQEGMCWENMGAWEIDHRVPLSAFNLADPEQQKLAFNFHNCRPLWKEANRQKSDHIEGELFRGRDLRKSNIVSFPAVA